MYTGVYIQSFFLGGLYDYPSAPDWDHYVDQSNNTKVTHFKLYTTCTSVLCYFHYTVHASL